MNVSVILAHPVPGSFNHAVAKTVSEQLLRNRHNVRFHDLYEEGFDPLLPGVEIPAGPLTLSPALAAQCEEIAAAGGIVIVHPNWWGQPPAILKGWVDRVIRPRVAYTFIEGDSGEGIPVGLLQARTALVFNTSNTSADREESAFGDPLDLIWRRCIFGLCGVADVQRVTFSVVVTSSPEQRKRWLAEARELTDVCFPAG